MNKCLVQLLEQAEAPVCAVVGASQRPEEFAVTLCLALARDVQEDML